MIPLVGTATLGYITRAGDAGRVLIDRRHYFFLADLPAALRWVA